MNFAFPALLVLFFSSLESSSAFHTLEAPGRFLDQLPPHRRILPHPLRRVRVTGTPGHRLVRWTRLDHRTKLSRFNNFWYYMLRGEVLLFAESRADEVEEPDGVYLSAVVSHSSKNYLYRGLVYDQRAGPSNRHETGEIAVQNKKTLLGI